MTAELTVGWRDSSSTSCNTDMDSVNNELSCAFHSKLVFSPGFRLVYVTSVIYCEEIYLIHHSLEFVVKLPVLKDWQFNQSVGIYRSVVSPDLSR